MRAVALGGHARPPALVDRPVPEPGPGQVRVAMRACGICGSDVHIIEGSTVPARLPIVLGHEASGIIDAVGPLPAGEHSGELDVARPELAAGTRVTVNPMITCGRCRMCRRGQPNYCLNIQILGLHTDGAHSECFVVPRQNVIALPDRVSFALGAIVADAIATPLRAITEAGIAPGAAVAVFGLGGLGLHAAMLLRQIFRADVIGVDANDAALGRAAGFGVPTVLDARGGRVADRVKKLTGGGVDAALEFVGSVDVVEQAVRSLAYGGTSIMAGVGPDRLGLTLRQETLVARGLRIAGSHGYLTSDVVQLLGWLNSGELTVAGTISHEFGLDDYGLGLDALRDRTAGAIRVVIRNG